MVQSCKKLGFSFATGKSKLYQIRCPLRVTLVETVANECPNEQLLCSGVLLLCMPRVVRSDFFFKEAKHLDFYGKALKC